MPTDPLLDHPLLRGLDPQQVDAVTTTAAPLAIIAAAGSGKTTVLTRRIAFRIAEGSAGAQHVLALTFTRDAAAEMKRRLRRLDIRGPIEAGTFHSVALRLLRDRALAANAAPPQVATDRIRLARECLTELRLRVDPSAALADLDWARARLVDYDRYDAACRAARRRGTLYADKFVEFAHAYERIKQRRRVLDFDDMLVDVLEALRSDAVWADGVRWRHRHFFVDEAQDLNPLQHAVLEALRDGRPDLCLVGDPRQAIYGWNGADPSTLAEVERAYPGVTVVRLHANYRCSPQVVRAGAAVLAASGQSDDTESRQASAAAVLLRTFADERAEAVAVAQHVRTLMHHHVGSELAVLARTNDQLVAVHQALTDLGIAVERSAGRSPVDELLQQAYACTSREQLAIWIDTTMVNGDELARRVAHEADRFLDSGAAGNFRAWIELRRPFDELDAEGNRNAVSVLTFHAAKGREWWGVVVVGAEDGLVPHSSASSPAQLAEEARLFYVSITRAAQHLLITSCSSRNGRPAKPSRWITHVDESAIHDVVFVPPAAPPRAADPLEPFRAWRASIARASGQPERSVCSDRVLRTLLDDPPASTDDLAARLGITSTAAARLRQLPSVDPITG